MKITFVLPGYSLRPAGGARVVYEYANHLVARGHQVSVVHPRIVWNRQKNIKELALLLAGWLYKFIFRPKMIWQKMDSRVAMLYVATPAAKFVPDSDIVFATSWLTAEYINQYPANKGVNFYLIQHYESWDSTKERLDATWRMPFYKIVISKWLYQTGLRINVPAGEMYYVPNGLNLKFFRLINSIESRAKVVGMMYHRIDWKGSRDGLAALDLARQAHPDLKVIVFGRDPRPPFMPSWVDYRSNPAQNDLVGQIYNQLRIFVSPSWTEGSPLPPAEAMACGCALVSTNCTGIDEYAIHQETALLSPIKQPEALAANIIKLLDDDLLRQKIALAGYHAVEPRTWDKSTDMLEKILREATKGV